LTNKPRGHPVDARTLKAHRLEDDARLARNAQAAVNDVVEDQIEEIATFIASMTLTDDISCSTSDAGRMWSKGRSNVGASSTSETSYHTRQRRFPDSRKSRVDAQLQHLSTLDLSAREFAEHTAAALNKLPPFELNKPSPFPLKDLRQRGFSLQSDLDGVTSKEASVLEFKRSIRLQIDSSLMALDNAKRRWRTQKAQAEASQPGEKYDTGLSFSVLNSLLTNLMLDHHFRPLLRGVDPLIQLSIFMAVVCNIILDVPARGCHFILSMLQYIVQVCLMRHSTDLAQGDKKLLSDFPVDIRSAARQFRLEGKSTIIAVCPDPKCHRTHKPTFSDDSPIPSYPTFCHHRQFAGGKQCKERLLRPRVISGVEIQVPIKTFVAFDFKDWVANLMSRPGYEDTMDAAWNTKPGDDMRDIFDGDVLRNFQGPDDKHFSLGDGEGRYVFSMCVDFFNPFTVKQAGQKCSIGMISLVCLNLPPDLRYKPENMFLAGIIPGPREPPLDTLNHYLAFLVDDLLLFWDPGVRFSKTYRHPHGRLVRCALVALVCDIPAARKTSGFAACSHEHFCSVCHCTRKGHGYGNTKYHTWKRRTNEDYRKFAQEYLDAPNSTEQLKAFNKSGVRWSQLLRLPYFDPTRFVVVDAMHNLFLGLIKEHFIGIIGIALDKRDKQGSAKPALHLNFSDEWRAFTANEQKSVGKILKWLSGPLNDILKTDCGRALWKKKLHSLHERVLRFACTQFQCQLPNAIGRIGKAYWVDALMTWVSSILCRREV